MSQGNINMVRGVLGRWGEGDFSPLPDVFHPDVVFVIGTDFPESGTYAGWDGVARYVRGFLEPWEWITISAIELGEVGNSVVSKVRQRGTGMGSGAETEFRYWIVWTFRDGLVVGWQNYRERDEAFAAAAEES
jgi:ketosteroid isomerase-like protein